MPVTNQAIDLYAGVDRLFRGTAKVVTTDEYRGGHLFVGISAQDTGPDGGLPTAAPFGLSDNPNGSTTFGYESLQIVSRTTEGGTAKSTAKATYRGNGLWAGMNVELTSANNGLAAEELTIVDATVSWPNKSAPKYVLTLGDPLVKLAQVLAHQALEAGVITATMISDGAISTPKLAANAVTAAKIAAGTITAAEIAAGAITTEKLNAAAVIANVLNAGGNVTINSSGIAVTGDAGITVTNTAGTVIIDGTANMFKIVATGTTSVAVTADGTRYATAVTITALGSAYTATPAHQCYVGVGGGANHLGYSANGSFRGTTWAANVNGGATNLQILGQTTDVSFYCDLNAGTPRITIEGAIYGTGGATFAGRYYVLKEAAV